MDIGHGTKLNVAFTGPECSGKSTLSHFFAKKFNGLYVREFSREYLEKKNGNYDFDDIEKIAYKQWSLIQEKSSFSKFIDTELIVLEIWSKIRFNKCCDFILNHVKKQNIDYFFLCKPDFPWVYDPLRENPYDRMELFDLYYKKLSNYSLPFSVIEGNNDDRIKQVEQLLLNIKK